MKRFAHIACFFVVAAHASAFLPLAALAQAYPTKPIRIVVPFPPGGVDTTIRLLQPIMTEDLGQPLVVENRAGANGFIGSEHVARSAPDGYTTLATSSSTLVLGPLVSASVPFDPIKDFTTISLFYRTVSVLVAKPSLEANTITELIQLAKRTPGRLTHGSSGIGSAQHVDAEILKHAAGLNMIHVPYKGGGPQAQAIVAQQIDLSFHPYQQVRPFVVSGKLKVLGFYNGRKPADLPDVPDLAQAVHGFIPAPGFIGLLGPAALPRPVVARLNGAVVRALSDPGVRAKVEANGATVVASTPEQFAAELNTSLQTAGKSVQAARAAGVKFE